MIKFIALFLVILFNVPAYAAMPDLNFTVTMDEAVIIDTTSGTPRIQLNVGGKARYASYASGSGTSALTFTYAPTSGDADLDGISLTSPLELNGGSITDLSGNAITDLSFTVPTTSGVRINYPSLSMNFAADADGQYSLNGTVYNDFSSFLTAAGGSFTRSSIATYIDSSGNIQNVSNDTIRLDHDPVTGAAKGLLIEESRTNLISYSEASTSNWSSTGTSNVVDLSLNALNQFDGVRITDNGGTWHRLQRGVSAVVASENYAITLWFRAGTSGKARVVMRNTSNAQETIVSGDVGSLSAFENAGSISDLSEILLLDGVTRKITFIYQPNFSGFMSFGFGPHSNDNSDVIFLGAQIEQGGFPTSYIPTSGTTVTRQADLFTLPVGTWYDQNNGTVSAKLSYVTEGATSYPMLWRFDDNSSDNRWNVFFEQSTQRLWFSGRNGGSNLAGVYENINLSDTITTVAAQSENNTRAVLNTSLKNAQNSWTSPSVTQLYFIPWDISKWIENFQYYPQRVDDQQIELMD